MDDIVRIYKHDIFSGHQCLWEKLSLEERVSGLLFYIYGWGLLLFRIYFSTCVPTVRENVSVLQLLLELQHLTRLYLYVDGYMDTDEVQNIVIYNSYLKNILDGIKPPPHAPYFIHYVYETYQILDIKDELKILFHYQVQGLEYQYKPGIKYCPNLYRKIFHVTMGKGAWTGICLSKLMGLPNRIGMWLGMTGQIVDDLVDYEDDKNNNITSLVTYHVNKYKNADILILYPYTYLPPECHCLYQIMCWYLRQKVPQLFSENLIAKYPCADIDYVDNIFSQLLFD